MYGDSEKFYHCGYKKNNVLSQQNWFWFTPTTTKEEDITLNV